jgi:hypothetical protein
MEEEDDADNNDDWNLFLSSELIMNPNIAPHMM